MKFESIIKSVSFMMFVVRATSSIAFICLIGAIYYKSFESDLSSVEKTSIFIFCFWSIFLWFVIILKAMKIAQSKAMLSFLMFYFRWKKMSDPEVLHGCNNFIASWHSDLKYVYENFKNSSIVISTNDLLLYMSRLNCNLK